MGRALFLMKNVLYLFLFGFLNIASACDISVRLEQYSAQSVRYGERWQGLDVELAKLLLEEAQCQYSFIELPWARSLKLLKSGDIDMMLTVSRTKQREEYIHFIGPQRDETLVFVSNSSLPDVTHITQLFTLPKPLVIQTGSYHGQAFEQEFKRHKQSTEKYVYVTDNHIKQDLLKSGRTSGYIEAKLNFLYEDKAAGFKMHPLIINQEPVYFAFSKKSISKQVLAKIEASYHKLASSGKFKDILRKYDLN